MAAGNMCLLLKQNNIHKPLCRSGPVTQPLSPSVGNVPILSDELMVLIFSLLCVRVLVSLHVLCCGHRVNLGYCDCAPNGQHLACWLTFWGVILVCVCVGGG